MVKVKNRTVRKLCDSITWQPHRGIYKALLDLEDYNVVVVRFDVALCG
jgi:hypothetical protein